MNKEHRITKQVEEYIAYKRALGYLITIEAAELKRFARFAQDHGHEGALTVDLALDWVTEKQHHTRWYKARRLETIHSFAKYALAIDAETQIPPLGVFGKCHGKTVPYIYTTHEVTLLMDQAEKLLSPDGLRGVTIATAIGLLWSTGLRVSEACGLLKDDVDYCNMEIHIRKTKFNKERYVPIHDTVSDALKSYETYRDKILPNSTEPHFFLSTGGQTLSLRNFENGFTVIRNCLLTDGKLNWDRRAPRLADLRHTFACRTILQWFKEGVDVNHKLLLLSTYLGHVKPSDTYWYLTGTPELLAEATKRFENFSLQIFSSGGSHEQ